MTIAAGQHTGSVRFLLVESESGGTPDRAGLVHDAVVQARLGHATVLLLVQEAVALALPDRSPELAELRAAGGEVWVDGFALAQRGLDPAALAGPVRVIDMEAVAPLVLDPVVKVVWH